MNNNINIAKLLKDCPKGTKLYSTFLGEVELKEVKDNGRSVCIFVTNFYGQEEMFYPDGKYNTHYSDSECTLFPSKEQRDWSKFCTFKDGDVLSGKNGSVFIFNSRKFIKCINNYAYTSHCLFVPLAPLYVNPGGYRHTEKAVSFATEEEKQKLFQAIKDNGYRWNEETKTLEKLVEPKFKVGDRIKHRLTGEVYIVSMVLSNGYGGGVYDVAVTNELGKSINIEEQDNYELVPNKFDITALKPFDKVLVRNAECEHWMIEFFESVYKNGYLCYKGIWNMCVPYEHNEHLLGTKNDCDEYYKTWKDETDE